MPEIGERMMMGALRSRGITVQRHRVRQMLHKVDPISSALRWHSKTKRKPYSVPGPNSLWHLGKNTCTASRTSNEGPSKKGHYVRPVYKAHAAIVPLCFPKCPLFRGSTVIACINDLDR